MAYSIKIKSKQDSYQSIIMLNNFVILKIELGDTSNLFDYKHLKL